VNAAQAYRKSASHRGLRDQEAEVFLRVNAVLRNAMQADPLTRSKAIADNEVLWICVMDLVRDPANQLPRLLRASILSVGHTVRRESSTPAPDLGFLIGINDQIAAGLTR
jgi:flagellar biosynthesis regulator FlaF